MPKREDGAPARYCRHIDVNVIYIHTKGKQMGLFLMMGFMWWWPLGLIILAALIANGRFGYRRRLQFAGTGPTGDWDHVTRIDRMGEKADRVPAKTDGLRDRVRGNWWGQPSSGNRAFDDYRAETLRRLEDEQREFKEFLKRLRVAREQSARPPAEAGLARPPAPPE